MTDLLKEASFDCKVSSVLNKNNKSYGKKFMFDGDEDTCWNSDSGTPQWVLINFKEECEISQVQIQFQGGFVGKKCAVEAGTDPENMEHIQWIYPEDVNKLQSFTFDKKVKGKNFKLIFSEGTDFFGRITIYKLSCIS